MVPTDHPIVPGAFTEKNAILSQMNNLRIFIGNQLAISLRIYL